MDSLNLEYILNAILVFIKEFLVSLCSSHLEYASQYCAPVLRVYFSVYFTYFTVVGHNIFSYLASFYNLVGV